MFFKINKKLDYFKHFEIFNSEEKRKNFVGGVNTKKLFGRNVKFEKTKWWNQKRIKGSKKSECEWKQKNKLIFFNNYTQNNKKKTDYIAFEE